MSTKQSDSKKVDLSKENAPKKIIRLSDRVKKDEDRKTSASDLIVGQLNVITDPKQESSNWVRVYRGLDGVFKAYEEFLEGMAQGEEICNYVSPAPVTMAGYRKRMRKFIKKRIGRQIFSKTICTYGEDAIRLKLTDDYSFRKTYISFENVHQSFFSEILLSKDRVLGASYSGDVACAHLMLDKDIAAMHLAIFNLAWRQARLEDARICQTKEVKDWIGSLRGIVEY